MKFNLEKSWDVFVETLPFIFLRFAVYILALGFTLLWFGAIFLLFTTLSFPFPAWLLWIFGGILYGKGASWLRMYVLYMVKAAHVGAITHLAVNGPLPRGSSLFGYGWEVIRSEFVRISVLFAVDRLVNAILRAFNRSVLRVLPFNKGKNGLVQSILDYSAGFVDEAILSYSILRRQDNPWSAARQGLVLYAQNWKTILGSGAILGWDPPPGSDGITSPVATLSNGLRSDAFFLSALYPLMA